MTKPATTIDLQAVDDLPDGAKRFREVAPATEVAHEIGPDMALLLQDVRDAQAWRMFLNHHKQLRWVEDLITKFKVMNTRTRRYDPENASIAGFTLAQAQGMKIELEDAIQRLIDAQPQPKR